MWFTLSLKLPLFWFYKLFMLKSQGIFYMNFSFVVIFVFHFFSLILCVCVCNIFIFLLQLPVWLCNILSKTKLLETMFDSIVFIDGVNPKRKLEVMDATKVSWFFFYSHVWHLSFVGWILCAIECYFCITLFSFSSPKSIGGT